MAKKSILAFIFLAIFANAPARDDFPRQSSLVALLASPTSFDGATVIIAGYVCRSGDHGYGLFLTRSDCDDLNYSNGVRLMVDLVQKKIPEGAALLTVEGRFKDLSQTIQTDEPFLWGVIEAYNLSGPSLP